MGGNGVSLSVQTMDNSCMMYLKEKIVDGNPHSDYINGTGIFPTKMKTHEEKS